MNAALISELEIEQNMKNAVHNNFSLPQTS